MHFLLGSDKEMYGSPHPNVMKQTNDCHILRSEALVISRTWAEWVCRLKFKMLVVGEHFELRENVPPCRPLTIFCFATVRSRNVSCLRISGNIVSVIFHAFVFVLYLNCLHKCTD